MSSSTEPTVKETGTLRYFQRSRTVAATLSIIALLLFLAVVYFTVPMFFTNFWLAPLLLAVLIFTRSYGSWDAYAKMRKQTDVMQADIDNISREVDKISEK